MLIEQIIEFELRGAGSPGRACTPASGYFHEKTKVSKENLREDYYLLKKYCTKQCPYFPLYLGQITYKI